MTFILSISYRANKLFNLVTAGDVGEITHVTLSKKGKDDWKVAHAIVVKQGSSSPKSHFFNFYNQLITEEGISVYSN